MADFFVIEGQNYISSKRASELTGYAKDYIGQLCRMGKIDAKLIGRNWFVSESSLKAHKSGGEEVQEETPTDANEISIPVHSIGNSPSSGSLQRPRMSQRFVSAYAMSMPKAQKLPDPRLLSGIDVRYYDGEPLFESDDRPLFPSPIRQIGPVTVLVEAKKPIQNKNISADEISIAFSDVSNRIPIHNRVTTRRSGGSIDGQRTSGTSVDGMETKKALKSPFSIIKMSAGVTLMVFALGIGAMTIFTERVMEAEVLASTGNVSVQDSYLMSVFK